MAGGVLERAVECDAERETEREAGGVRERAVGRDAEREAGGVRERAVERDAEREAGGVRERAVELVVDGERDRVIEKSRIGLSFGERRRRRPRWLGERDRSRLRLVLGEKDLVRGGVAVLVRRLGPTGT